MTRLKPLCVGILLSYVILAAPVAVGQSPQSVIFTIDPGSTLTLGYGTGQGPNGEGATSPVLGHFLVEFDATSSNPSTIDFELGHGYLDAQVTGNWLPGLTSSAAEPADFGVQISFIKNAVRDLVWDWTSDPIANNGDNTFNAASSSFEVLSMYDRTSPVLIDENLSGFTDSLSSGSWSLSQSIDGWSLDLVAQYADIHGRQWFFDVATSATFNSANFSAVIPDPFSGDASADALGGAGGPSAGGVSAAFTGVAAAATFSAQQLPNSTSFSQAAVEALADNSLFALTTGDPAVEDQIWNLNLIDDQGDDVSFNTAVVQIHYDDSNFAPGFNELQLGLWHFNSALGEWEYFNILDGTTTVDTVGNVITVELDGFSELQLGIFAVPEPSTISLGLIAGVGLACYGRLRSGRRRRS